ncbi:MAG: pyridoxal-phosphate dependent enzyme [Bacteroidia bacterium]|nr:pyridoxal-phosphate dependent enzyme [Bacteroidia bacterium]
MLKLSHRPDLVNIQTAHKEINAFIHRTPVMRSTSINEIAGCDIHFKCENFQKIGAFKMRGASCAGLSLSNEEKEKGLATHSSGNHAQAVALTAKLMGTKAYIVMPSNSPEIKKRATAGYGAEITFCEPTIEARKSTLDEVVRQTGATFIHPYDNYNVICGQATCAKEFHEDITDLDAIMAPIGGGGLMSGTALCTSYMRPTTRIYGAEPEIVNDAYLSLQKGEIVKNTRIDTIADGLRTNLSDKTFEIIREHVTEIFTVTEQEIVDAMRLIWERMKIIIEPSCSVPLAALLKNKSSFSGQKVGIILTGGNVDLGNLPF